MILKRWYLTRYWFNTAGCWVTPCCDTCNTERWLLNHWPRGKEPVLQKDTADVTLLPTYYLWLLDIQITFQSSATAEHDSRKSSVQGEWVSCGLTSVSDRVIRTEITYSVGTWISPIQSSSEKAGLSFLFSLMKQFLECSFISNLLTRTCYNYKLPLSLPSNKTSLCF